MNLFPEDFDWEAAIRYWRSMGDLYRKESDTTTYGPAAHCCAKRVIRLGEWRNLWQNWKAAQQHPTIHRPRPTATAPTPIATVVAPPPSGIPPASVSGIAVSSPNLLPTHAPPAPSRTPQKPVTSRPATPTVPKLTISGPKPSVPHVTVSQNPPATSTPTTLRTLTRSTHTVVVMSYTTLPQSVVIKTIATTVDAPAPPTSVPVPEPESPVFYWPAIPCDPDYGPRLPNGFICGVQPGRDIFEILFDPEIIYEGKPCDMENNPDLPRTWICIPARGPQATLERGYRTRTHCETHQHAWPEDCGHFVFEPMDGNGILWDAGGWAPRGWTTARWAGYAGWA